MSGTRHKKMNMVRMKKKQLLYPAEENRAKAIYILEEQQRRERNIINEMKHKWQNKKEHEEEVEEQIISDLNITKKNDLYVFCLREKYK